MSEEVHILPDGTVTSPSGFAAGAAFAGMKTYTKDKLDLGILLSETPCATAGTFTKNLIKSSSLVLTQELVAGGRVRGVVVNSGIANACVGEYGMTDAQEMVALAVAHLGMKPGEMAICSTGLIGTELPMGLIRAGIPKIAVSAAGGESFARAILTTDRRSKSAAVQCEIDGKQVTIGGCVKGSGMIHPNMATMLAFLTTNAAVEEEYLRAVLPEVVDDTFNMATIDGDGSTNDTVLFFANGAAGNGALTASSPDAERFASALRTLCDFLCREMVRDAEGSSKIFSVRVESARSREDARLVARAVASSSLVKSAVHGNDPNWGRVIVAAGRSGGSIEESKVNFYINDVAIMEGGRPIPFHRESVIHIMSNPEVSFTLRLNLGDASATAWGCELTEEYVTFNSAYTT
jgi:glutamate N-acetyltransferase/amino-acid N-acetyltransferase